MEVDICKTVNMFRDIQTNSNYIVDIYIHTHSGNVLINYLGVM